MKVINLSRGLGYQIKRKIITPKVPSKVPFFIQIILSIN
jgi:hypothetical protein